MLHTIFSTIAYSFVFVACTLLFIGVVREAVKLIRDIRTGALVIVDELPEESEDPTEKENI